MSNWVHLAPAISEVLETNEQRRRNEESMSFWEGQARRWGAAGQPARHVDTTWLHETPTGPRARHVGTTWLHEQPTGPFYGEPPGWDEVPRPPDLTDTDEFRGEPPRPASWLDQAGWWPLAIGAWALLR